VPDVVRELRERLARLRGRAAAVREGLADAEREIAEGMSFTELRGRHEFCVAEACVRRIFSRISGTGTSDESSDLVEDMVASVCSIRNYATLGCNYHCRAAADSGVAEHSVRVGVWAMQLAAHMGLDAEATRDVVVAALVHDVGMIEAQRLSLFRMDRHPTEYAAPMLAKMRGLSSEVFQAVCQHHEYADGSGYPRRLSGSRISRGGRILSAANQMDLLVTKGLSPSEAAEHMRHESSRYDPEVLSALFETVGRYPR
jgi:HD-GYP domain-containing protein (c-di-GMP phosphodiesterase class II)